MRLVNVRKLRHKALAMAICGSLAVSVVGVAYSQATTGTIYGQVPVASGETIHITGGAGYNRTITVGSTGRYSVDLPVGTYTVSLLHNGSVVQTKTDVSPVAAGSVAVDFTTTTAAATQTLAAITVTALAIPPIDVTTTTEMTTITAKQLRQLPIARNAESVALLAPGVTAGAAMIGGSMMKGQGGGPTGNPFLVFGGASVAENAYYIDGMNTTDSITGQGGVTLPYGAIEQQQTLTSGYGAKYGRSIGGVINQIGKSGSNEWHFGARVEWDPAWGQSEFVNNYWGNPLSVTPGEQEGDLRQYNNADSSWTAVYDAYASGPIIKNKLFFFVAAEDDDTKNNFVQPTASPTFDNVNKQSAPKLYAKINWNINENNFLTLTAVQDSFRNWSSTYYYNPVSAERGAFALLGQTAKNKFTTGVLNFTSYLSDSLTLRAMFGKTHGDYMVFQPEFPGFDPALPTIINPSKENPAFAPPGGYVNSQVNINIANPAHRTTDMDYRLSLDWKWLTHDFSVGIDNLQTWDRDDGNAMTGPGYAWNYGRTGANTPITGTNINDPPYAGPPDSNPAGDTGYYVGKYVFENAASVRVLQTAEYVQDNWQVTPNLLLNLGLRDDQFTNYNPAGVAYLRLTRPQWAPRLGFSWDVYGDSSMKVYGNLGRYYLALPSGVALREAGASTYTNLYGTYTGIDPTTGEPTGFAPVPQNPATGVSSNNEYGEPLNAPTVAAANVKAEYADVAVLGMQKLLWSRDWVFGAQATYHRLGRILDDWDDNCILEELAQNQGYSNFGAPGTGCDANVGFINGSILINPGETEDIYVTDPKGGLDRVVATAADQQFPLSPRRHYYSLELSLTHSWNGKWYGKIDYVYSRSYGNTEGPVQSDIGQGGTSVSATEQWDYSQLMEYSDGVQINDQKHQLKFYGAYQIDPQWLIGANLFIGSGHPIMCLGYYGADHTDPLGYAEVQGGAYHYCGGQPAPPGSTGFTPWTEQLNLNAHYFPRFADHKLDLSVTVLNALNQQRVVQYFSLYGSTAAPNPSWMTPAAFEPPRTVMLSAAFDW